MRVVVLGAGAVGSLLGWALARGGADVTLVGRAAQAGTLARATAGTVTVVDPGGQRRAVGVTIAASLDGAGAAPPDLVVCAVKMNDLAGALDALDRWPAVPLLTVQNGVGAEALALAHRPDAPLIAGSVSASASREPDGVVRWWRLGGVSLAPVSGAVTPLLQELATCFASAGLPVRLLDDHRAMKWSKLVVNLVGNASSAILDMDPAAVYGDAGLFELERRQLREALAVMAAEGLRPVDLPGAPVRLLATGLRLPSWFARPVMARVVGGARGGKAPSLRLHVAAGRGPSEVDWLNGAVVARGADLGVPTPANQALLTALRQVTADATRRAWYEGHPERLLALVTDWHTGGR